MWRSFFGDIGRLAAKRVDALGSLRIMRLLLRQVIRLAGSLKICLTMQFVWALTS